MAQRLKRMPQIIRKLDRAGTMRLAQMQDIGGCRVILAEMAELRDFRDRIVRFPGSALTLRHEDDYCGEGRPDSGYRALHLIMERDSCALEVQLRTTRQHAWAEAVERAGTLAGFDLKAGEGPDEALEFFLAASDAFWLLESGDTIDRTRRAHLRRLRSALDQHLPDGKPRDRRARLTGRHKLAKSTNHWLIIYDWKQAVFKLWQDLGTDAIKAADSYAEYERRYSSNSSYEIVLIGADSAKTIETTHAHYFGRAPRDIDPHGYFEEIL